MKPPVSRRETPSPLTVTFEAVMPAAMAVLAEEGGIKRASLDPMVSFVLSVLAGAFVAFGAIFSTTVLAGTLTTFTADGTLVSSAVLPYGIGRLLAGLAFCVGIIAVIIAGAELFTGNNLIVMAWASGKVTTSALVFNWVLVLTGNCVGAILTAGLIRLSHGRRRLLVCVPAEENGRAAPLSRERLADALLRRLRVRIKRRHVRLLLRKSGRLDSKELRDEL
jgi:hypothetical protein